MKLKLLLTAKGNPSLLVWNCPEAKKELLIKRYLGKEAEQIGFVNDGKIPRLNMMGGELCINSTLALAGYLGGSGQLQVSGVSGKVSYTNQKNKTLIELPLEFIQKDKIILFEGIGFICKNQGSQPNKKGLVNLSKKYNLPAFGVILYKANQSTPYVYVRNTDSLVAETACGSGSVALSIVTGFKNIGQPNGGSITVKKGGNKFQITAKVKEIVLKGSEKI